MRLFTALSLFWACQSGWTLSGQEPWGAGDSDLVLSEIHYHPALDEKKEEFVELHNSGTRWLDIGGWTFTAGIEFKIPEGTVVPPGGFLVIARDKAHLSSSRKISNVVGDFKGDLGNNGEILELRSRTGRVVASVHYQDGHGSKGGLWPGKADGQGPSLELVEPHPDWHRPWYWAPSRVPGGTPGRENSRSRLGRGKTQRGQSKDAVEEGSSGKKGSSKLRINEAKLEEPDPFIEIMNDGSSPQSLDGLRLTADPLGAGGINLSASTGSIAKKKLFVLDAQKIRPLLSPRPSILFLVHDTTSEIVDSFKPLEGCPPQGSFGRYPDGSGDVASLARSTPGAPNAAPHASDIVINEINYNSLSGSPQDEFVELFNRGKSPVSLKGWKIGGGASFSFPDEAIPPGGYAVVAGDPQKLASRLTPEEMKQAFGPLKGKLSNSGDTVLLVDSWGNAADRVHYKDKAPWPTGADGRGFSLELINPDLDNRWPQAWVTGGPEGTPLRKNARAAKNIPPAVTGVRHEPAVPDPDDAVLIHAHVLDTASVSEVAVVFRDVGANSKPTKKSMTDNGQLEDGAAHDGHYTARLPRFRPGTLVGFSVIARDSAGRSTRYPDGDRECFFQVEPKKTKDASMTGMPVYRILMPREAWEKLQRSSRNDETLYPCTFIGSIEGRGVNEREGEVYYEASIRYRGKSSRNPRDGRMSYRLRLDGGGSFDGRNRFILNAFSSLRQKMGGDVMRLAGLPISDVAVIRFKTPTFDDNRYVDVEVVDNEFLANKVGSTGGDLFRCERGRPFGADLAYHGPDPAPYLKVYQLVNNKGDKKIPGLLKLLEALDTKDEETYAAKVEKMVDVAEWAMYFAANNVLGNNETTLSAGDTDDYFLAQRGSDGKFILIPWDQDSVFTSSTASMFRPGLPSVRRFLQHPRFAPLYLRAARELIDGPLSTTSFAHREAFLRGIFKEEDLKSLERYVDRRQVYLRERYPQGAPATLQAEGISSAGFGSRIFLAGTAPEVWLEGFVDPAIACTIKVGGNPAEFDPVTGRWSSKQSMSAFSSGPNAVWIELLGPKGESMALHSLNVERVASIVTVPATISSDSEWKPGSPYFLPGAVTIQPGATLRIGPGVNVVCGPGAALNVRGLLLAQGNAREPIAFRPSDWGKSWFGVRFLQTGATRNLLSFCRFEGGRAGDSARRGSMPAVRRPPPRRNFPFPMPPGDMPEVIEEEPEGALDGAFLRVEGSRIAVDHSVFRGILGTAIGSESSQVEVQDSVFLEGRSGISASGGSLLVLRSELRRLFRNGIRATLVDKESAVKSSVLQDVLGTGITLEGGKLFLDSDLIHGSSVALLVLGGADLRASHLTLAGNGAAVEMDRPGWPGTPAGAAQAPSRVEIASSILGPAYEPVLLEGSSQLTLSYCLWTPLGRAQVIPKGEKVVRGSPRFVAGEKGDFRLEKDSPGHGAAPDGQDLGFRYTPSRAP